MTRGDNLRERTDGTWEGRYYLAGKRKSVYGKTFREAQRKLRDAVTAADRGEAQPDLRRTTAAWLETWLNTYVRGQLRPQTITSYEGTVDRYIVPAIGKIPVAKLTVDDVSKMLRDQRGKDEREVSARTKQLTLTVLRIALNKAVIAGVVSRNVAKHVPSVKQDKPERDPFTPEQVSALIEATRDDAIGPLIILSATTGLRQGEALALRWQDVDLDAGAIVVSHTLDPKTRTVGETKTKLSRRTIVLPVLALEALRDQQQRQRYDRLRAGRRWHDDGFVFATRFGTALDARNVDRRYHAAREALGLPNVPWHHLRHYTATALLGAGVDLFVVSRILGHASISTTAAFYSHVQPSMLRKSADRMDDVMRRAAGG